MSTDPRPATEAGEPAATSADATAADGVATDATGADSAAADAVAANAAPPPKSSRRNKILLLIAAVIAVDVAAAILVPPFPLGHPGEPVTGISDLIMANLEFPAPHVVWPAPDPEHHEALPLISADVSITNTLLTMWIVMAVLLAVFIIAGRRLKQVPGRLQNALEFAWEGLENWAISLGGSDARRHIPLFAAFFLFILFSNWSGLLPFFGKIEALRAPTSDVNVTIGLALVAFIYFHYQGFRRLGVRGYLGKFFVFTGFRNGIASGFIDLFVGLIEFILEFIKPVTLAMRLFGNIFGGEVALGVITALTIALIPAGMLLLEGLLNFVQALIFSTLMLMYTVIAVESHHVEEHEGVADVPEGGMAPPLSVGAGSH
ncbi:MAG TPA: FoF1 ATP synthase subunit a [Candidatus Limnocylindria bacterium]|nr:FoF1 ATP synthase subunit a [Candidatus Limnocylindria bacterium]